MLIRDDDARWERSEGRNDAMNGVFVEEGQWRGGSRLRVAERGWWARVGLAVVRVPQGELALLGFLSSYMVCWRRTRPPFKLNMGPHGGDDVPSIEVAILQLVFVLKIGLKRRVFELPSRRDGIF